MDDKIISEGITFDDVLLMPAISAVSQDDLDLSTDLTRNIRLQIPLVSSPMDTVTESALAIALAQEGGLGIIHRNLSIADQSLEVKLRAEHLLTRDPREKERKKYGQKGARASFQFSKR